MSRPRILFVAMAESVHTARWISQLEGQGWDVHLFPAREVAPHPRLRGLKLHESLSVRPKGLDPSVELVGRWPLPKGASLARSVARRLNPAWQERAWRLARTIRELRPDIVHSLEIQHAGYLTLDARAHFGGEGFPVWAVSNWGSDIYLFGRLAAHAERVRAVMAACDYYHCECHRDVGLAREFGFEGEAMPVFPVSGGFEVARMRALRELGPPSSKRHVVLKGVQNWAGRALVGLRAIELCADLLQGYRVTMYLAHPDAVLAAELLSRKTGIGVEWESGERTHEDILRMHGSARASIGLSISDAISTSLLEAMIMGSFPIQSHTGCGDEWVRCGENGLLVHPESPEEVAAALRRALTDDALVDEAAETNARLAAERLDKSVIGPKAVEMYLKMAAQGRPRKPHGAAGAGS
jgi:glycosyltransferase involved in cell wall biosynthesis